MSETEEDALARLELGMAMLARMLEALSRRRNAPLERSHYLLLRQLQDGPLAIGALSSRLALDATTVTRQVAAMERRGLVERQADEEDRRVVRVTPSAAGMRCAEEMRRDRMDRMLRLLDGWSEDDIDTFAVLLDRMNEALHTRIEGLR